MKKLFAFVSACALALSLAACSNGSGSTSTPNSGKTSSDKFPNETITLVCPFSAGGGTDLSVRGVLDGVTGVPTNFSVSNVTGNGGLIGLTQVANSAADGYTLGVVNTDFVINIVLGNTDLTLDSFSPLACALRDPFVLIIGNNENYSTLEEFVAYAKANPGKIVVGETGTGAAPIVADIAKEAGILTVGVVTKPFGFEGRRRMQQAELGIEALKDKVDSLVIIPNERLKFATDQKITFANAFEIADDVLRQAVQSISDLIKNTGFINVDFADVTAVMKDAGMAHMGVGRAAGKNKAEEAAKMAISSPLLETSIDGARGVLVNITGSMDIGLEEVETAADMVRQAAHPDALIIFGAAFDEDMEDEMQVTVIATGYDEAAAKAAVAAGDKPFTRAGEKVEEQKAEGEAEGGHDDDDQWQSIFNIFNRD